MLTSFGFLLLSTVYILPDLRLEIAFYPRPWISTILLGGLLLYMGSQVWPQIGADAGLPATVVFYALLVLITAAAWAIPGLLLALIVIMLGASSGNRVFMSAGIVFLILFIASYFYGIEVSMLTKSITLVATGIMVLASRWLLLKIMAGPTIAVPGLVKCVSIQMAMRYWLAFVMLMARELEWLFINFDELESGHLASDQ